MAESQAIFIEVSEMLTNNKPIFITDKYKHQHFYLPNNASYPDDVNGIAKVLLKIHGYINSQYGNLNTIYFIFDYGPTHDIKCLDAKFGKINSPIIIYTVKKENINRILKSNFAFRDYGNTDGHAIVSEFRDGNIYTGLEMLCKIKLKLTKELSAILGGENIENKYFYKYRSLDTKVDFINFDKIIHEQIYVSHPSQFNDIFDTQINMQWLENNPTYFKTLEESYKQYRTKKSEPDIPPSFKGFITNLNNETRILSLFTINPLDVQSNILWAHYANQHTGYVVEYNIQELIYLFSQQINQTSCSEDTTDQNNDSENYNKGITLYKVYYPKHNFNPITNLCNLFNGNIKNYSDWHATKDKKWSYEEEYRIVFSAHPAIGEGGQPLNNRTLLRTDTISIIPSAYYSTPKPRKIYIGHNCSQNLRDYITDIGTKEEIKTQNLTTFDYEKEAWEVQKPS